MVFRFRAGVWGSEDNLTLKCPFTYGCEIMGTPGLAESRGVVDPNPLFPYFPPPLRRVYPASGWKKGEDNPPKCSLGPTKCQRKVQSPGHPPKSLGRGLKISRKRYFGAQKTPEDPSSAPQRWNTPGGLDRWWFLEQRDGCPLPL